MGQGWILFNNTTTVVAPVGAFDAFPGLDSRPARAGDVLTIFCSGLGPTDNHVPDGVPAEKILPLLARSATLPVVTIGGVEVPPGDILFAGLSPGPQLVALFQISFFLPEGIPPGDAVTIQIRIGEFESPALVTMAVE